MNVNVTKLDGELKAAGIPIDGVGFNQDGTPRIDFQVAATPAQIAQAQTILAAHDPSPTRADKIRALGYDPLMLAHVLVSRQGAGAPGWAQAMIAKAVSDATSV